MLQKKKSIKTSDLFDRMNISLVTMRRDLKELEREKVISIGYGYVKLNEKEDHSLFISRLKENYETKKKLINKAIEYIDEDDTLFMDESTTSYILGVELSKRFNRLHIITNGLNLLLHFSENSNFFVQSCGGTLQHGFNSLIGPKAEENLQQFSASKAFFSCSAIHENGLYELSTFTAKTKKIMLERSQTNYLIADSSKFKEVALYKSIELEMVKNIITNYKASFLPKHINRIIV